MANVETAELTDAETVALTPDKLLERMSEQTLTEGQAALWAAHADHQALWSVLDESMQLLHEAFGFLEVPAVDDLAWNLRIIERQAAIAAALHEAANIERTDGEGVTA